MNVAALHRPAETSAASRWLLSAAVIAGAHAAAIAAALSYYEPASPAGEPMPTILIDLSPATAAPTPHLLDLAPGPEMQETETSQAEQPPPPPAPEQVEIAATPPEPVADVPLPREAEPKPADKRRAVRAKSEAKRPKPAKPRQITRERPADRPPAPQSSAPQRADRRAMNASAALAGAEAAAVLPSYRQRVAAHLQRFKRYPAAARSAGEQGTATLAFTLGRSGHVLGARLVRSSGDATLDAETLAMVRRAEPLPPFPPELRQSTLSFSVPVNYSVR